MLSCTIPGGQAAAPGAHVHYHRGNLVLLLYPWPVQGNIVFSAIGLFLG